MDNVKRFFTGFFYLQQDSFVLNIYVKPQQAFETAEKLVKIFPILLFILN